MEVRSFFAPEQRYQGRLISLNNEMFFLFADGSIEKIDNSFLCLLLTDFNNIKKMSGSEDKKWAEPDTVAILYPSYMMSYPGKTIAYILKDELHIIDGSVFKSIISADDSDLYISASEYAKKVKKGVTRIKTLCSEGRIPGAFKKNNQWRIPKDACYPEDMRVNNGYVTEQETDDSIKEERKQWIEENSSILQKSIKKDLRP